MRRLLALFLGVAAVLVAAVFLSLPRAASAPNSDARTTPDSVWYHASDVALLATTGRPQLLEFFHPS